MKKKNYSKWFGSLFVCSTALLQANPQNPTVVSGTVNFDNPNASTLEVTSESTRAIVDWETFSITSTQTTEFILPSSSAAILNRVTETDPSNILGTMTCNGQLFLINPNGIIFGPNATVDTATLVASTLDVDNSEFLSGNAMTFTGVQDSNIFIENQGTLTATSGDVVLLGYQVINSGDIYSEEGTTAIGCGLEIVLDLGNQQKIAIQPHSTGSPDTTGLSISGYIRSVTTELKADGNFYELAINHDGTVDTRGISGHDGHVRFEAVDGKTYANGLVTCLDQSNTGGRIDIVGDDVEIGTSAELYVAASYGDGEIYIGGGFQGSDPDLINSQLTLFSDNAVANADGLSVGTGGTVVVWSDDTTYFQGTITSRGGQYGGDGGTVEVSGLETLSFTGSVDVTSPTADDGILLLDPQNLEYHPASREGLHQATPVILP